MKAITILYFVLDLQGKNILSSWSGLEKPAENAFP